MPTIPTFNEQKIRDLIQNGDLMLLHQNEADLKRAVLTPTSLHGVLTFTGTLFVVKNSPYSQIKNFPVVYNSAHNILLFGSEEAPAMGRYHDKITENVNDFIKQVCSLQQNFQQNLLE